MLGDSGYAWAWLELAGALRPRAVSLLQIRELNFELKCKAQKKYLDSGLVPTQEQVDRYFGGVDPLLEDGGKRRVRRV